MASHDTHATGEWTTGTFFEWTHTIPNGKLGILIGYKFQALATITGVTVGGSSTGVTFRAGATGTGGGNRVELWEYAGALTGAQTIRVTFDVAIGDAGPGASRAVSISALDISGFADFTVSGPTTSTTPNVTVPNVGANDIPYGGVYTNGDPTEQDIAVVEVTSGGNFLNVERQAAGGDGVLNWTEPGGDEWLTGGFRAVDSGGGGSTTIPWLPGQTLVQAQPKAVLIPSGMIPPNRSD